VSRVKATGHNWVKAPEAHCVYSSNSPLIYKFLQLLILYTPSFYKSFYRLSTGLLSSSLKILTKWIRTSIALAIHFSSFLLLNFNWFYMFYTKHDWKIRILKNFQRSIYLLTCASNATPFLGPLRMCSTRKLVFSSLTWSLVATKTRNYQN